MRAQSRPVPLQVAFWQQHEIARNRSRRASRSASSTAAVWPTPPGASRSARQRCSNRCPRAPLDPYFSRHGRPAGDAQRACSGRSGRGAEHPGSLRAAFVRTRSLALRRPHPKPLAPNLLLRRYSWMLRGVRAGEGAGGTIFQRFPCILRRPRPRQAGPGLVVAMGSMVAVFPASWVFITQQTRDIRRFTIVQGHECSCTGGSANDCVEAGGRWGAVLLPGCSLQLCEELVCL